MNLHRVTVFLLKELVKSTGIRLFGVVAATLVLALVPMVNIYLLRQLLNILQTGHVNSNGISWIFMLIIVVQIAQNLLTNYKAYAMPILTLTVTNHISELIMARISDAKYSILDTTEIQDDLYFLRTQSTSRLSAIITDGTSILTSLVVFSSMFAYLFNWNHLYAVIGVVVSVPLGLVQIVFNRKSFALAQSLNRMRREQFYLTYIGTTIDSLKEILPYSSMKYLVDMHNMLFKTIFSSTKGLALKQQLALSGASITSLIGFGYIEYESILSSFRGEMLLGTLSSILQALSQVSSGIQGLIVSIAGLHSDWLYLHSLYRFFANIDNNHITRIVMPKHTEPVTIKAKDLSYFIGSTCVFRNLNFEFSAGSRVGIIGQNGSGKTTLVEIINGLRDHTSGELLFNSVTAQEIPQSHRFSMSQMLQQRPVRYELSVRDNVRLSDVNKIDVDVFSHVVKLDPGTFLAANGFRPEDMLGEWYRDSHRLSGGEWQKVALYRLLNRDAAIYILDEPTNNLDGTSVEMAIKMIEQIPLTSTVIIISHDIAFLERVCSSIYELNESGLFKVGSNEVLDNFEPAIH